MMYFYDNKQHHLPHIHAEYNDFEASILIETGEILNGEMPKAKLKLVQAWIEIHRDELMANWKLAISGEKIYKIEPLK